MRNIEFLQKFKHIDGIKFPIQDVLILVPQSDTINIFTLIVELH